MNRGSGTKLYYQEPLYCSLPITHSKKQSKMEKAPILLNVIDEIEKF